MASIPFSQTAAFQTVIVSSELPGSEVKKGEMPTDHQTESSLGKTNYCSLNSLKPITRYCLSHNDSTGPQPCAVSSGNRTCYLTLSDTWSQKVQASLGNAILGAGSGPVVEVSTPNLSL